ncbi:MULTISPECIES: hypothetical protein [Pseudomonas]|uniref:Uncharacterized protein n=1 Tax=Pseudomonas putida TaxID=303 RepID=A0AAW6PVH2_PSEPU|nr:MULTISPECIES: hypothetical protein [Pseudomonas]MBH3469063.1 hypothetical protein [Pseudomonas putida]MCE0778712.1 hypothetical protein [Pseudomonas sp. NMI542_15]MCE1021652.1 hypothetical protein [Pseudomonas monteilii]MCE1038940.1 hypothetical protein [Pseudomonas monteilii]MCE1090866.1 hypothetical protein [Pseudomonas monteilii]
MGKKRNQAMRDAAKQLRSYKKKGIGAGGRIGLGLESSFKPKKVKRDDVVLDAQTTAPASTDKSILYVPGWSLSEDQS